MNPKYVKRVTDVYTAAVNIAASVLSANPPNNDQRRVANFELAIVLDPEAVGESQSLVMHFVARWTFGEPGATIEHGKDTVERKGMFVSTTITPETHVYEGIMETASIIIDQALKIDADDPADFMNQKLSEIFSNAHNVFKSDGTSEEQVKGVEILSAMSKFGSRDCDCESCKVVTNLLDPYMTQVERRFKSAPVEKHTSMVDNKDFGLTDAQMAVVDVVTTFCTSEPVLTHKALAMVERTGVERAVVDDLLSFGTITTGLDRSDYLKKHFEAFNAIAPIVEQVH